MAEELRFFLRTAAYTAVIAVIYWVVSYEWAGSVMLAFVALATGLVVVAFFVVVRATRGELNGAPGAALRRACRIGGGALILPGVEVGEEAFVATGSIVTRDVPARTLVMGAPARRVRDIGDEELIEQWR